MKITKVSVKVLQGRPRLKGTASVVFDDCFKVRDIFILPRNPEELYAAMPSKRLKDNHYISLAHPITAEFRNEIETAIFAEYDRLIKAGLDSTENEYRSGADEEDPEDE